jgi:Lrp/AsnC family leucine-responsive transcriptional regulator
MAATIERLGELSIATSAAILPGSGRICHMMQLDSLERAGIIAGYRAVVSPLSVGLHITAFVRIKLASHTSDAVNAVEQKLRTIPDIVEAYVLAGDYDYLLKIVATSFDDYEGLLREQLRDIPSLASIETTFAFGITKQLAPLPIPPPSSK